MRSFRVLALAVLALALPIGLVTAVYVTSANSLASPTSAARVPTGAIAEPSTPPRTEEEDDRGQRRRGSDRCAEPEHRGDPECRPPATTAAPDTPVQSGGDDNPSSNSGSSNSGSGSGSSSNSGSGSGSDSNSGSDSGSSSSSGSGADESDSSGQGRGRGRGRGGDD